MRYPIRGNGSQSRDNFTELPSAIEESNSVFVESDNASLFTLYRDDESRIIESSGLNCVNLKTVHRV